MLHRDSFRPALRLAIGCVLATILAGPTPVDAHGESVEILGCLTLPDFADADQAKNLSGAATTADGDLVLLATDEGSELLVLDARGSTLAFLPPISLGGPNDEIDFEGVTRHGDGTVFFAIGSHSWRRKSIDGKHANKPYRELKERFEDESPDRERDRDRLIRLRLDPQTGGLAAPAEDLPLRRVLDDHPVLAPFGPREKDGVTTAIPSKENGIDIEGVASDGEKLYLGFRGPVFRHGLAAVLIASPAALDQAELRYVPLDGRGIRDIARVSGGFLIIAGPVGDSPLSYQLYLWDGDDAFPGRREAGDPPLGEVSLLGEIPTPRDGKAEALVVLTEDDDSWRLLVLYDGPPGGSPACFRASKPSGG